VESLLPEWKSSGGKDIPELPPYIYTTIAENPYPSMDTPP
jgi:hypothetical protein